MGGIRPRKPTVFVPARPCCFKFALLLRHGQRRTGRQLKQQVFGQARASNPKEENMLAHLRRAQQNQHKCPGTSKHPSFCRERGLTPQSSGPPTAWRLGQPAQGLRPILRWLSKPPHRRCPLTSNVRHHRRTQWLLQRSNSAPRVWRFGLGRTAIAHPSRQ